MGSDKPIGAENQQGSRAGLSEAVSLTPQRLHAELLAANAPSLVAYLLGALGDATFNARHNSHRFGQKDRRWLDALNVILGLLGARGWIYREGRQRDFWILETTAQFLRTQVFEGSPDAVEGLAYVRGFFDAEGGMPRPSIARLYFQLSQKDLQNLELVREILESWGIACGRVHNPSVRVDPNYWRFYVRAASHERFMRLVGSWHPRKREQIDTRMKI